MSEARLRFPGLSSTAFVSPTDRIARENLEKLPLLPVIIRKFNELAIDRLYYVNISATSVRCGPKQYATLYALLQEACAVLEVPEPELYLSQSPEMNAFTAGVHRPFIALHSGIVDQMTDEELLFVLGHELGHIKCGHVLYQMLARVLMMLLEAVGQVTLRLGQIAGFGLVSAFFEWMRQAEFSCDRAGMLVCQDQRVALSALMKLACGGTRYLDEMDPDAFLEQARAHAESAAPEGIAKTLMFFLYNWQLSHPQVVYRAKGLDEWVRSGAYDAILRGDYQRGPATAEPDPPAATEAGIEDEPSPAPPPSEPVTQCLSCGKSAPPRSVLCPYCRGFLSPAPATPHPAEPPENEEPV